MIENDAVEGTAPVEETTTPVDKKKLAIKIIIVAATVIAVSVASQTIKNKYNNRNAIESA